MLTPVLAVLLTTVGKADADVQVRVLSGAHQSGTIRALAADGAITIGDTPIPGGTWYSLRRPRAQLPAWPAGPHAEFGNGDRLAGTVVGADGDVVRLRVTLPAGRDQELGFPLSSVRVLWLTAPPADAPEWLAGPRDRDVFQFRNGDVSRGALTGIDSESGQVRYQAAGMEQAVGLPRLAAIGFNTDLARVRRPKGPYCRLVLSNGTRMCVTGLTFDGQEWTARTRFKEELRVPAAAVMSVDVEQGQAIFLSDLKPVQYRYEPFDTEQFGWAADRNLRGGPLMLRTPAGGSTYDRGLGLHAECAIRYALGGKFRRFECWAGVDARDGVRGDAVLEIALDGRSQMLDRGGRLTARSGPLPVELDVAGAKELMIRLRRGGGGHVGDRVNLVDARLVP